MRWCQVLLFFSILHFYTIKNCVSQPSFQNTYKNGGTGSINKILQDNKEGFICIGSTSGGFGAGGYDIYLLKVDSLGDTLWTNTFGSTTNEYGTDVLILKNKNILLGGYAEGLGNSFIDLYIVCIDSSHQVLWSKTFGGNWFSQVGSMIETKTGEILILGGTDFDFHLIKIKSNGDTLWTKKYGGLDNEYAHKIVSTADEGYLLAGESTSFSQSGDEDIYIIRTDSLGDTIWTKSYGDSGKDASRDIVITPNNTYIIIGETNSYGAGGNDIYLLKINDNGDTLWTKTIGGAGDDKVDAGFLTSDNGLIITGSTSSFGAGGYDCYIIKTDSLGDTLWTTTVGGWSWDYGYHIIEVGVNEYLLAGSSNSFDSKNAALLIKFNANSIKNDCLFHRTETKVSRPKTKIFNTSTKVSKGSLQTSPTTIVNKTKTLINKTKPTASILDVQNVCFGMSNGSARVSVNNGSPAFTYRWNDKNNQSDSIATGLTAGAYVVTVTDMNKCTITDSVTINEPSELLLSVSNTNSISCNGWNDGILFASVSGGTTPYDFLWSNGLKIIDSDSNWSYNLNLSSGNYYCTVIDINKCFKYDSIFVNEPLPIILINNTFDISCSGANDGSSNVSVSGGVFPYTYSWSSGDTSVSLFNLAADTYYITVTDKNSCTSIDTIFINEPDSIKIIFEKTNASCYDIYDGSIMVSVSGGTPQYSYKWNTGNTLSSINQLKAGIYILTILDLNACMKIDSISLFEPDPLQIFIQKTDNKCFGGTDGIASISVSGGIKPYSYFLSNNATTPNITELEEGVYSIKVIDSNDCAIFDAFFISDPESIKLTTLTQNVSCYGFSDGTISVSAYGGVPGYIYKWSNNSTNQQINSLIAGNYTVSVTDSNNCKISQTIEIIEPDSFSIIIISDSSAFNQSTGYIDLTITGGTTPYQYLWSNNATSQDIDSLPAGTYNVYITDANSCKDSLSINVYETTSIQSIQLNIQNFNLYPNPNTGTFTINLELYVPQNIQITVANLNGQIIYSESIENTKHYKKNLNLLQQTKGVYSITVKTPETTFTRQVVLE